MILSLGEPTSNVESLLGLTFVLDDSTPEARLVKKMVEAAEGFFKERAQRNFEQKTYTDQEFDIEPGDDTIFLSDYPVITFASLKEVLDRDDNGAVSSTRVISPRDYHVEKESGLVESLAGAFPSGRKVLLATYDAGYTPSEITANSRNEIQMAKDLLIGIIDKKVKFLKEHSRDVASVSLGDQSATIQFDLDGDQQRLLRMLSRDT